VKSTRDDTLRLPLSDPEKRQELGGRQERRGRGTGERRERGQSIMDMSPCHGAVGSHRNWENNRT